MSAFAQEVARQMALEAESEFLNDAERDLFVQEARLTGQHFLQMVRRKSSFASRLTLNGVTYFEPIPMGEQEIEEGHPLHTLVFPSVSQYDSAVFALNIRTISARPSTSAGTEDIYDASKSLLTVTMHDPRLFEPQAIGGAVPHVRRSEQVSFGRFNAIFKEVFPFALES